MVNNKLVLIDNSVEDFSDVFRLLSNSGLVSKSDVIYTNSSVIYHYCLYCRIKYNLLYKPTKQLYTDLIKNTVNSVLLINLNEEDTNFFKDLCNKYDKDFRVVDI